MLNIFFPRQQPQRQGRASGYEIEPMVWSYRGQWRNRWTCCGKFLFIKFIILFMTPKRSSIHHQSIKTATIEIPKNIPIRVPISSRRQIRDSFSNCNNQWQLKCHSTGNLLLSFSVPSGIYIVPQNDHNNLSIEILSTHLSWNNPIFCSAPHSSQLASILDRLIDDRLTTIKVQIQLERVQCNAGNLRKNVCIYSRRWTNDMKVAQEQR